MSDSVSHVIASMGLRAPRVALVVPGWDDWKLMVRGGIHAVTTMWGGAGFIVVPVPEGDVHSAMIAAVRAYDPDSILVPQGNSLVTLDEYPQVVAAQEALSSAPAAIIERRSRMMNRSRHLIAADSGGHSFPRVALLL
jgi:hypothetical protein